MYMHRAGLQQARVECNGKTIVGFSIDAADYGKFATPTTKSTAKLLGGMHRIKNKITGVEFFSEDRKLFLFRSLPDVTTGANLTLTILTRYLSTPLPTPTHPASLTHCLLILQAVQLGMFRSSRKSVHQL